MIRQLPDTGLAISLAAKAWTRGTDPLPSIDFAGEWDKEEWGYK